MIEMAGVGPNDVVYEPGCGDARITIAAVKAGAAKGVGIDLDPQRVAEAQANVKAANLEGRIEIRAGDALDIKDLAEATVVFLYMGDEFDRLIRPILWDQLRVGSRVVSHRFTMGDWKPDRTTQLMYADDFYNVHMWTITEEIKKKVVK
jgi:precorrin-6B methylase 2